MYELIQNINWRRHTYGLMLMGGSFILLIASLVSYLDRANDLELAERDLRIQETRNIEAQTAEDILVEKLSTYISLREQGLVGDSQRLQWVETLRYLAGLYSIPNLQFTLDSSHLAVEGSEPYWRPEIGVQMTTMRIVMQLVHEGDLYRLLNGLRARAPGMFDVNHCDLRWALAEEGPDSLTRLTGVCSLHWLTLVDATVAWNVENE